MRKIKIVTAYDGTWLHGYQKQADGLRTVQQELENAFGKLLGEPVEMYGASRTDAGVHALGQTSHFETDSPIPPERFAAAVTKHLPSDISVQSSCAADECFHARFSATGKTYHYVIDRSEFKLPNMRNFSYHVPGQLDLEKMERAMRHFIGEHDFSAFRNVGSVMGNPVRTIDSLDFTVEGKILTIRIHGTAFLYRMVRNIAGTLLEVGWGRVHPDSIPEIIESKDRARGGQTLPPHGLCLMRVDYNE